MRILLVEDDLQLAEGLKQSLNREGFIINHAVKGSSAITSIAAGDCDMVILDLGLPDMDGMQVLKSVRDKKCHLPVLILTARDSIDEKVRGLDTGADDYIIKPFDMKELLARLRVIERRLGTAEQSIISVGNVTVDIASHSVSVDNTQVELSKKDYIVLRALMENAGRVVSKDKLESRVYEWGEEIASNAIEVRIHHLRRKLPEGFIKTIHGVGYTIQKS
ncbi:response regulator [Alteromonas sp. a30]|uniref:response regulator n=1 Tax=Alteromonas sp. a30 TaxID=2730917 RepID=UPI00227DD959|nr:response regulator [Alteromonas sp. a30]MCY7295547.1 response regulator [Alteromonas sp. a30]